MGHEQRVTYMMVCCSAKDETDRLGMELPTETKMCS